MLCFSYGSNMSGTRLRERVPSARFVAVATLPAHRLRFDKIGQDGSAKCDAEATGDPGDLVVGVVYEMPGDEKAALDRKEGLGVGYEEKVVEVIADGRTMAASMYVATLINSALKPFHWYKRHILVGAHENGLPAEYVARIEAVESVDDPDTARRDRELAIYR